MTTAIKTLAIATTVAALAAAVAYVIATPMMPSSKDRR
jgi:phage shock protein PspC (stress-responsive transcriptional regulator)